ncbi:MAG: glycosidase [Bacteroidota bacterium]
MVGVIANKNTFQKRKKRILEEHDALVTRANPRINQNYNGIFHRYKYPVLTPLHTPVFWRYDYDFETNPHFMERLEINSVFNAGAIEWNGKILMMPRIESNDVKSFFGIAESTNGVDNFKFWDYPTVMPQTEDPDMNVYDIRLVEHEDGWIYGLFCAERKDKDKPYDSSAAIARNGMARTKDLVNWERLPDIISSSPQQRNCVLHPEFVDGKYAFYTRPMDGFIETGGGGGIGWGTCQDILYPKLDNEIIIDPKKYHTVKEVKNGLGPAPLKTKEGWLHLAHGVRRTAAGLRYVLYLFLCDLDQPWKVIRQPGRHFIAPMGMERVGDVSNVVFSNGWVLRKNGDVFIYYASSDTRMHVATTTIEKLLDYIMNTPEDAGRTYDCVQQRIALIDKNQAFLED